MKLLTLAALSVATSDAIQLSSTIRWEGDPKLEELRGCAKDGSDAHDAMHDDLGNTIGATCQSAERTGWQAAGKKVAEKEFAPDDLLKGKEMTCENLMPFAIQIQVNWKNSQEYEKEYRKVNKMDQVEKEAENVQLGERGFPGKTMFKPNQQEGKIKARTEKPDPMDPYVTIEYCQSNELCTNFTKNYWNYFYTEHDCAGIKGMSRQLDDLREAGSHPIVDL